MYSSVGWSSATDDVDVEHVDPRLPPASASCAPRRRSARSSWRRRGRRCARGSGTRTPGASAARRATCRGSGACSRRSPRRVRRGRCRPSARSASGRRSRDRRTTRSSAHPIITVGAPMTIGAPHPDMSPTRSAGRPPISTVELPIGNGVGGCGGVRREAARVQVADDRGRHPGDQHGRHARARDHARVCRSGPRPSLPIGMYAPPRSVDLDDRAAHRRLRRCSRARRCRCPRPWPGAPLALNAAAAGVDRHAVGLELELAGRLQRHPARRLDRQAWRRTSTSTSPVVSMTILLPFWSSTMRVLAVAGGDGDRVVLVVELEPVAVAGDDRPLHDLAALDRLRPAARPCRCTARR